MDNLSHKMVTKLRRQQRIRTLLRGTAKRPRLVASISNTHAAAQLIDDETGKTIASATSVGKKIEGNLTTKAEAVGQEIAKKAKKAGVSQVVFDRRGHRYHGRVKALADKARDEGLEF